MIIIIRCFLACAKRETFPLFIELLSKTNMKVAHLIRPQKKLLHINSFHIMSDVVNDHWSY